ncbi:hypothetical protein BGZ61DRAFT_558222 [Ilyonectria robusta]|uniref:uncharacterized protein n=1 Tax=Ilyonectria robusta TaxID=1079257 RepID=UPI001E8ED809|nr:uncharacterized protein BGZ61DRAFT_558222 [Ilyonectria robusta]KAH8667786.1 hypothetical protein BGZ61DRAFT_558222 [Ilyonectria robusta]
MTSALKEVTDAGNSGNPTKTNQINDKTQDNKPDGRSAITGPAPVLHPDVTRQQLMHMIEAVESRPEWSATGQDIDMEASFMTDSAIAEAERSTSEDEKDGSSAEASPSGSAAKSTGKSSDDSWDKSSSDDESNADEGHSGTEGAGWVKIYKLESETFRGVQIVAEESGRE